MMRLTGKLWVLALVAALTSAPVSAQDLKIGVVNLGKLVSQSPQAQQARSNMKEQFSERKKALQNKREQLQQDVKRLKRDGSVMSEEARQKLEESIRDQQRQLKLKQSEYNDDVQQAEQKELQALRDEIRSVIQQYADDHNYDLIVGQGVLYATDQINVTGRVLQRLKARN